VFYSFLSENFAFRGGIYMETEIQETVVDKVRNFFTKACTLSYPELKELIEKNEVVIEVTRSTQENYGHYQFNSAMKLAQKLKAKPRQIADDIVKRALTLPEKDAFIEKLEVAGPGFVNVFLKPDFLAEKVQTELQDTALSVHPTKKQKVVVDFSSPNTAKEMHVGHLRSTIIGDSLARIFEFLGHEVLRLNHIGDFGTSFGMLIAYMKEKEAHALENIDSVILTDLVQYYKASKKLFDEDAEFKKCAQSEVVALQSGEKEAVKIWQAIRQISLKAYQEIYDLLDVKITERGESFYNPYLAKVVSDAEKKGVVSLSDGAKCIFLEGFVNREGEKLPLMIQKSDGGYNYDTTDLAAVYHRVFEEKADRIIYVVDAGQSLHFQMVFQAAEKVGYLDPKKVKANHVPFGLVLGSDGKKFRTRSGETEKLIDLLITAISKAEEIVKERNPDWDEKEQKALAKALGIGAVKYADLSVNRASDYAFSYEKMLRFEGNTAAFIMYSYVRANGIKRKVGIDINSIKNKTKITLTHPSEIALALHLARFSETIEQIVQELLPNRLTDYLYELAEKFNQFFRHCRVEGTPEQNSRLLLTEATSLTLKKGLDLLGVQTVERM
jgi:arginyl-tRNA synthetase